MQNPPSGGLLQTHPYRHVEVAVISPCVAFSVDSIPIGYSLCRRAYEKQGRGWQTHQPPGHCGASPAALLRELDGLIEGDRYFLSPRIKTLKAIRAKIRPEPVCEPLLPSPKQYAPPRARAKQRRRAGR